MDHQHRLAVLRFTILLSWLGGMSGGSLAIEGSLVYERDIRPILAENCFACHGPDAEAREANLRLDVTDGNTLPLSGTEQKVQGVAQVVDVKNPDTSELLLRVLSPDPDRQMPPPEREKRLNPEQVNQLRQWISEGARADEHWAFLPVRKPEVPVVQWQSWVRNPIDAFVLKELEALGMEPSKEASASTLRRRLSIDLTGLPPVVEERTGPSPSMTEDAYSAEVERLLASPHFGERWARWWLDAARYADSDGFEKDKPRRVWMYRDWVIQAFNEDLPYDQFIIKQVAGDLLPNPTQGDHVATGFLRNSMLNEEGGIDPEQFRMEAMFDRMDAVGKAILGLTIQCAQCHSHKYDPISHEEYYQLFAFLNNCHEGQITVYTSEQRMQWERTLLIIRELEEDLKAEDPHWRERLSAWEDARKPSPTNWRTLSVVPIGETSGGQKHYVLDDHSILALGYAPTQPVTEFYCDIDKAQFNAFRIELLCDPNLPHGGPGRSIFGHGALTEFTVTVSEVGDTSTERTLEFTNASADVNPPERELDPIFDDRSGRRRVTGPISLAWDKKDTTAWTWDQGPGRSNVPHVAVFNLKEPLKLDERSRITFKLAQQHGGWNSDDNQNNNLGRFRISASDDPQETADETPIRIQEILAIPRPQRTSAMTDELFSYWRTLVPHWRDANRRIEALWQSHPQGDTQLVLIEREAARRTYRLERGNFLKPAEQVEAGVPKFLHPLPPEALLDRLTLARWLVAPNSPTTARSLVNRIWQAYFGSGIVATADDLGTQGAYPTHPELLDYLAWELVEHGWSQKHIHRLIVQSATYRQSSQVSPPQQEADPNNKWLARGARFRVEAEVVRDIGLAVSGLLTRRVGGPSVFPPAPAFLFEPPASYGPKTWIEDHGPNRYRRGMYTFRFRSVPHPALTNFDAPNGDFSCVRRVRSNSPLQALTALNEELAMECAQSLARRILAEGGATDHDRCVFGVRCVLSREPQDQELHVLQQFVQNQREHFAMDNDAAEAMSAPHSVLSKTSQDVALAEIAAWTSLARVLLNLDETMTRE